MDEHWKETDVPLAAISGGYAWIQRGENRRAWRQQTERDALTAGAVDNQNSVITGNRKE